MSSDAGSGAFLPASIVISAVACALVAAALSLVSIYLHLRNYRKVHLQRQVVRILFMIPIYSLAAIVSILSAPAAFFVDAIRDCYEAFVIYCFFQLLVEYLGGERSLIILLLGRPPTNHTWPINLCLPPIDVSDPFSFLGIKRGIMQYAQIKPVLAFTTMFLKAAGKYTEGTLKGNNGYTYIAVVYNISISLALYCLVLFWTTTYEDLKPFRPIPKFACIKLVIAFLFWQSFFISILVSAGAIHYPGYTKEDLSLALSDVLVAYEMPMFSLMHWYAFSYTDYIDQGKQYAGRMPFYFAMRDCLFGFKDVFQDSLVTYRGKGFSYKTFEPAEGGIHHGLARDKRSKAGLRYAEGGKKKYWLPMPGAEVGHPYGRRKTDEGTTWRDFLARPIEETQKVIEEARRERQGYAPIAPEQAVDVVRDEAGRLGAEDRLSERWEDRNNVFRSFDVGSDGDSVLSLEFDDDDDVNALYQDARRFEFGDYNFPVTDASKEDARQRMRKDEEALISGRWPTSSKRDVKGKGKAVARTKKPKKRRSSAPSVDVDADTSRGSTGLPDGCVDLVVEDKRAAQEADERMRRTADVTQLGGRERKVFRQKYKPNQTGPQAGGSDTVVQVAVERDGAPAAAAHERVVKVGAVEMTEEVEAPAYTHEVRTPNTEQSRESLGSVENGWV